MVSASMSHGARSEHRSKREREFIRNKSPKRGGPGRRQQRAVVLMMSVMSLIKSLFLSLSHFSSSRVPFSRHFASSQSELATRLPARLLFCLSPSLLPHSFFSFSTFSIEGHQAPREGHTDRASQTRCLPRNSAPSLPALV